MTCEQVAEQLDMYALGGLDADKEADIARHIATCVHCQQALDHARRTADVLALVTESPRPSGAWKRRIQSAIQPVPRATRPGDPLQAMRLPGLLELSPASLTIIMVLLVAVGVVWGATQVRNRLDEERGTAAALKAQLEDRDTLVSLVTDRSVIEYAIPAARKDIAAVARFYADPQSHQGGLVVWNLPGLPAGKRYQVWLIDAAGAQTSAGAFQVGQDGSGSLVVHTSQPLGSYRSLDVTIEPAGGSRRPTGQRVLTGTF